jgi:hypothetical protein
MGRCPAGEIMIPKIINFPVAPNAQMLRACINPDGCSKRVSNITIIDGTMVEICLCPSWGVSKYGKKITYGCGYVQKLVEDGTS